MIFESLNHNGEKKMEAFIAGSFCDTKYYTTQMAYVMTCKILSKIMFNILSIFYENEPVEISIVDETF